MLATQWRPVLTRDELSAILFRHDPIGLAAIGAPKDEYDCEATRILPRLPEVSSPEELRSLIHQEFLRFFDDEGTAGPESAYDAIAQDVWERIVHR